MREHSGNIEGPFQERIHLFGERGDELLQVRIQGTFREHPGNIVGTSMRGYSGNIEGTLREH
jgi:hypothetical protein